MTVGGGGEGEEGVDGKREPARSPMEAHRGQGTRKGEQGALDRVNA